MLMSRRFARLFCCWCVFFVCLLNLIIYLLRLMRLSVCLSVCVVCSLLVLFPFNLAGINQSTIVLLHGGDEATWAKL